MDSQMIKDQGNQDIQTITTIKQIEQQIRSMYTSLEEMSVLPTPNLNKQNKILSKIEDLQKLKTSLYQSLSASYASTQSSVAEARMALVDETAVAGVISNELQNANKNLSALQSERYNKTRMAEINDYYSSKYETQSKIMKTIVYFCIPILILGILLKKSIIPQNIALSLIGILTGLAVVVVFLQAVDVMRRDNMVFDEYKFPFDADNVDLSSDSNSDDQPKKTDWELTMSCKGESCCPEGNDYGTVWDDTTKQCVTPNFQSSNSEGFVGERCLQSSFNKPTEEIKFFKNTGIIAGYGGDNNDNYAKF